MKKISDILFAKNGRRVFIFFIPVLIFSIKIQAQVSTERQTLDCDPFVAPVLFGLSQTYIFCKNNSVGFGVSNSKTGQKYRFSVYRNGGENLRAGPLSGNGGQLSISETMRCAQNAGEYRVTATNDCGSSAAASFYAFYGSVDNLSITGWGGNAVTFNWMPSGPKPAVTYYYAVTTQSDPTSPLITYLTTTDTTASVSGLVTGTTYYIHVRVKGAVWNAITVNEYFNCPGGDFPTQTLKFISCAGTPAVGSISPAYAVACNGGTTTLTASGGNTYQWYKEDNSIITGATTSSYTASTAGEYRVYITTGAGCAGMVSSATVTQTSVTTGVFSGGGCFHVGDSVRLGISKTVVGQTYKVLKDGVEVASLQGIGKAAESIDTIWYNFKFTATSQAGTYTVRVNNPYCTAVDFGSVSVSTYGSWIGTLNVNWGDPLNWSCGGVPDANTDVIIKSSATHFPEINASDAYCKSLDVETGASIKVKAGLHLFITGP